MPVRVLGMIGVSPPRSTTVHVIAGAISPDWIASISKAHEAAGYDEVLVGYYSSSADGFATALYAGTQTERLSYLLAHRPGRVLPALMARKLATLDQFLQGRLSVHIIIGGSDPEQQAEGDFLSKEERYRRGAEYLDIMRRMWTDETPLDYEGTYYRLKAARSEVRPFQKPYPTLMFGGASKGAMEMGAEHCDMYALFGEPLKETAEQIAVYRAHCDSFGRPARFNVSFRPIIADTEGQAWDRAHKILETVTGSGETFYKAPTSQQTGRLLEIANRGDVHDERLWTPITAATNATGNTTCLVGTADQVSDALLKYYRLGVESFLLRGFELERDLPEFGRELIPMLREKCRQADAEQAPA